MNMVQRPPETRPRSQCISFVVSERKLLWDFVQGSKIPVILTVSTPFLAQDNKAALRAAPLSDSDFTCLNSMGCHRAGPSLMVPFQLRKLRVTYLLVRREQRLCLSGSSGCSELHLSHWRKPGGHPEGWEQADHTCWSVSLKAAMAVQWRHPPPLPGMWLRWRSGCAFLFLLCFGARTSCTFVRWRSHSLFFG